MKIIKSCLPNILSGFLFIVLGIIIISTASVPLRQLGTGWLNIDKKAAFVIGILVVLSGLYPFYIGIRIWIKSRQS